VTAAGKYRNRAKQLKLNGSSLGSANRHTFGRRYTVFDALASYTVFDA